MTNLRRTLPSLNSLYAIEAVSRHLNFTNAATDLGISQPAVSKSIRQVEQNLGVQLFVRRHRGLSLTPEGKVFTTQVRAALAGIDQAAQQISADTRGQKIKINVSSSFVTMWLVPRIAEFKSLYPSVLFEITENHGDLAPQTLSNFDFTTRIGMGDWGDVVSWRLARERLYALASPEYMRRHPDCMQLATLQKTDLLHASEVHRSRMGWKAWFEATGTPYASDPDVLFSDHHSAIHAALVGQGVALGWHHLIGDHLQEGRLVRLANTAVQTEQNVYLVAPRDRVLHGHHDLFRQWVMAQFQRDDPLPDTFDIYQSDDQFGE